MTKNVFENTAPSPQLTVQSDISALSVGDVTEMSKGARPEPGPGLLSEHHSSRDNDGISDS
jgi:hypothetical protein